MYFVNSGHTLNHERYLIHSGEQVPEELIKKMSKEWRDQLIAAGTLVEKEPTLRRDVDQSSSRDSIRKFSVPLTEKKVSAATVEAK